MKYIGILMGLLLWPAACMAPPTYGPYPTGGGGLSSNEVYAIALSIGGPTNGISAATATNIVNNNNAASATWATNVHNVDTSITAAGLATTNPLIYMDGFSSNRYIIVNKDVLPESYYYMRYDLDANTLVFGRPIITDGSLITNLSAAAIKGDLSVDTLTATTLNVDAINGNGSGLTNIAIASFGQPAMTAFSAHSTIAGASLTANGEYGWNFRLTRPLKVYALGKYRITGNTNVVSLQIRRTNDCALIAQTTLNTSLADSNKFNYAMLPSPVLLTTNYSYSITFTHPVGGTDSTLGITTGTETITTADGIIPIYAVSASVACSGFSGWPSNSYGMVNFLSYPGDEGVSGLTVTKQTDASGGSIPLKYDKLVTAPDSSVALSLLNSFSAPPQDNARFMKKPLRSFNAFLDYYPSAPPESAFTNLILLNRTNGMLAAGWDHTFLDDGWQASNRTANGSLTWNTNLFPNGLPWLTDYAHTNGFRIGTYFGWSTNNCLGAAYPGSPYWTFKDPYSGAIIQNQLSNDVFNAYAWGFDGLFYDNSCGPQSQSEEEVRAAIRIFNDVGLKNRLSAGKTNRGMVVQMGGNAFGNDLTNSMFPYDVANGVNVWTINGNENSLASPINGENTFFTKTKQSFDVSWFVRRGHYITGLLYNGNLDSAHVRILMSSYVMGPISILISPSSVTGASGPGNMPYFTNATWIRHYDDPATIPGRSVLTNGLRAEIWMRPFGSEVSQTNLICFINANTTNNTLNFSNSFLGFDASKRLTFTEIFTGTNYYVTNGYWPYVQTPSNAVTFVVYPTPSVTNYFTAQMLNKSTPTVLNPNSTGPAPHYFAEGIRQAAATTSDSINAGFSIEPEVREVTVQYHSESDAGAGVEVYWRDKWTTWYHSPSTRAGGVNWYTNIFCTNNIVTFTSIDVPMPVTNAWKQLNWTAEVSTNSSGRIWPYGVQIIKWK